MMTQAAEPEPEVRPLEAAITPSEHGWEIRLPLRREVVRVEKRVVVAEEVTIGRERHTEERRVEATARRERLRVDTFGEVEAPDIERRGAPDRPPNG
jgi:uncharacterized protein (TIGR02271 family)